MDGGTIILEMKRVAQLEKDPEGHLGAGRDVAHISVCCDKGWLA